MNVLPELLSHGRTFTSPAQEERWDIRSSIVFLRRRWRLIAICLVTCILSAVLYLAVTPAVYTSTAVLVTDTKQTPPSPSQVTSEPLIDPTVVESQVEIIRSLRIAADVVDRLNLVADPEFVGGGASLIQRMMMLVNRKGEAELSNQARRMIAADTLLLKTKVTRTGHSYLAEIAVTTSNPDKSAEIANAIADAYIRDQLDGRLLANQRTEAWMKARVDQVKRQADDAVMRVELYRRQITAAALGNGGAPPSKGLSSAEPLKANDDVPATLTHDSAMAQLRAMADEANAQTADYEALQNRYSRVTQFMQQQSLPVTEARLLTSAEPSLSKSAPKSTVIMILSSVGGLVLGVALAFGREISDHRVRWPSQIRDLGLPFAGSLPFKKQPSLVVRNGKELQVSRLEAKLLGRVPQGSWVTLFDARRPWCAATQTLLSLKLAVDQSSRRTNGVVVGIVSPWPGEGKSTLGFNFARLLVEIGARVLVVDADFTSPALSRSLAPVAEYGLVDLAQQTPIEQCVSATTLGFDLLSCSTGSVPIHPFHLPAGRNMLGALVTARDSYQYILIDLPALLTSVDPQAIALMIDAFVLVTDYGRTTSDDVEQALATSEALSSRLVATIINRSRTAGRNDRRALRHVAAT